MSTAAELISVAEAQRLVLERAHRLEAERVPSSAPQGACSPSPPRAAPICRRSRARRWTGSPSAPPTGGRAGARSRLSRGSPPGPRTRPLGSGEAMAIATGGAVPEGAERSIPLEVRRGRGDGVSSTEAGVAGRQRARARQRHPDGRDRPRAGRAARAGAGRRARRRGGRTRCSARSGRAWGSSSPARSSRRPARSSPQARSTSRTASCSPRHSAGRRGARAARRRRGRRRELAGDGARAARLRHAHHVGRRLGGAARPRAAGRRRPARRGGLLGRRGQAGKAGRVRRCGETISSSTCPGTRCSVLVTFELFVRPAVNALLGLPDPEPRLAARRAGRAGAPERRADEFVRARARREGTASCSSRS